MITVPFLRLRHEAVSSPRLKNWSHTADVTHLYPHSSMKYPSFFFLSYGLFLGSDANSPNFFLSGKRRLYARTALHESALHLSGWRYWRVYRKQRILQQTDTRTNNCALCCELVLRNYSEGMSKSWHAENKHQLITSSYADQIMTDFSFDSYVLKHGIFEYRERCSGWEGNVPHDWETATCSSLTKRVSIRCRCWASCWRWHLKWGIHRRLLREDTAQDLDHCRQVRTGLEGIHLSFSSDWDCGARFGLRTFQGGALKNNVIGSERSVPPTPPCPLYSRSTWAILCRNTAWRARISSEICNNGQMNVMARDHTRRAGHNDKEAAHSL